MYRLADFQLHIKTLYVYIVPHIAKEQDKPLVIKVDVAFVNLNA